MYFSQSTVFTLVVATTVGIQQVAGHTWIDAICNTNTGLCGYVRNYGGRFGDLSELGRAVGYRDILCAKKAPFDQTRAVQRKRHGRLAASPGNIITGLYTENGHISLPINPDSNPGTIRWYGTANPKPDDTLEIVLQWTPDGKGGNGRGRFLGASPFDDGKCFEDNHSAISEARKAKLPKGKSNYCRSSFKIPEVWMAGKVGTVYWVWDFAGKVGSKDPNHHEWYTSCMDINIIGPSAKFRRSDTGNSTIQFEF